MALQKVGALWLREGQKGKFMAGEIEIGDKKISVMVFKNDKGDNPKRPDYTINQVTDEDSEVEEVRDAFKGEIKKVIEEDDVMF